MSNANLLSERELATHLESLLKQKGLTLIDHEVRLGSFRLDAVAYDPIDKSLVVVELKTTRWSGTLAQLLLYPRALRLALSDSIVGEAPRVRSLLITTYMDKGLIDLVDNYALGDSVELALCVGSSAEGFRLVGASDADAEVAIWDQAQGVRETGTILRWLQEHCQLPVKVRGGN